MRGNQHTAGHAAHRDTQKVVVVNGDPEVLDMLDPLLDPGRYDTVFVDSASAYSLVRYLRPDRVVVCMHIDEHEVLPFLSMLALDDDTRRIPMAICFTELAEERYADEELLSDFGEAPIRPPLAMN